MEEGGVAETLVYSLAYLEVIFEMTVHRFVSQRLTLDVPLPSEHVQP